MKKTVLITGASRGIGKAIALYLAPLGYDLALTYNTNVAAAEETRREVLVAGTTARLLQLDIRDRDACREKLSADMEAHGVYYGVICNAGIAADAPFPMIDDAMWDGVLQTNLNGFYNVLHPIVMPMISNRIAGRIITLSSVSGIAGNRGQVNYSAAKAGIIGATKALALELAKRKITVNCIAPGVIETDMTSDLPAAEEIKKMIPLRRFGTGREVAALAAYLLSEDAAYVTRQVISVNGGLF